MSDIKRYEANWDYDYGDTVSEPVVEAGNGEFVRYEDVADLIAEHDPTPATKEWLDDVFTEKQQFTNFTAWDSGRVSVLIYQSGNVALEIEDCGFVNPVGVVARGDVLTALRLFKGKQ